jgi:hypothetical protein
MFYDAIQQAIAVKDKAVTSIVKLGKVTSVSGGRAYVQHYGEGSASNKQYTFIDQYFPEVNDIVAMLPQGNTWIIIGKVCDTAPVQKWATVDHNHDGVYLPVAYKNKLEDSTNILEMTGGILLPNTDNTIGIGSSTKQISAGYFKALYADGTQVQMDRIQVTSGGTTYSLILSYASSTATLTPSADGVFALGTSSKKFKEAWLGLFRGSWKSGQSTERQISWNSSNALVPDTNESVDLGTSSLHFKDAYLRRMIGTLAYSASSNTIGWASATVLQPSATNSIELGASGKQFNAVYTNKLYLNGTEFSPSGLTMDTLTTKYGSTNYTLALSVKNGGSSNQFEELTPSVNNKFNLGNSSYKLQTIYLSNWHNGTRYITFDSSHNILPDTTNAVSLGTSNKQYKNIYGQNVYVNGTAVSSDRRVKDDIKALEEKHIAFFKALRPVQFKYKDGESGRTHTGFIAQEVEEAVQESGMTDKDMAVVVKDPEDNYYLRYEEIISVQTKVIQDLMARVESLEARITKLEGKGENK